MSASKNDFALYCCDLLAAAGPCVAKRMFGGFGISTDGLTLAIVADLGGGEKLWLKADEDCRAQFEAAGCARFIYQAKGKPMGMNYYSAPEEAMESPALMAPWARLSLACALKARAAKIKPPARSKPAAAKPPGKAVRSAKPPRGR
ncbi:MAG: TfoX/Sxy family protein [Rhodoferax sp.]|nr:TfoX/Sxy family protein [Rhodoferax sp.]MBK9235030.1 TfoX/Sxy family protein [Rhodoferax sp.]